MTDSPKNWVSSDRFIPKTFVRPALRFTSIAASSGIVLLVAAVVALLWANLSPFADGYESFWGTQLDLSFGPIHLEETLKDLVNDGLMAVFFFVVGLEIKRELVTGELRNPRKAALPAMAALGGMVAPALIFILFVGGGAGLRGWGIPMATDIAFSLGVLALLGSRVPVGAKLFLLALAIVDDIGAIAVIAVFYTDDLSLGYLALGIGALLLIAIAGRVNIRAYSFYVPVAIIAWFGFLESGVHATIAGVALGLLTPARPLYDNVEFDRTTRRILDYYPAQSEEPRFHELVEHEARLLVDVARESVAPLSRLEHALHNWSSFVIIPVFALANAGVRLVGIDIGQAATSKVALGVAVGLLVGKTVGVSLFAWLAVQLGWGILPRDVTWRHIIGTAILSGIGFTVALFIAELAYVDPELTGLAKIGIFMGSIAAGFLGYLFLRREPSAADHDEAGLDQA